MLLDFLQSNSEYGRGGSTVRVLTSGAWGRQFKPCSYHVGFVVDEHRVRGFSRGSPVPSHFLHSTNRHPSGLSQKLPKDLKNVILILIVNEATNNLKSPSILITKISSCIVKDFSSKIFSSEIIFVHYLIISS